MDFKFILDKYYLGFYILQRKMKNETKELSLIKKNYNNNIGYKKIKGEQLIDISPYVMDNDINNLLTDFIYTSEFNEIYKFFSNYDKREIAIKALNGKMPIYDYKLYEIKNYLWDKHRIGYKKIMKLYSDDVSIYLKDTDCKNVLEDFIKTNEYKKLYEETKKYMDLVQKEWQNNKNKINKFLSETLKIDFAIVPTVYITHPNSCGGCNIAKNEISWGHFRGIDDKNYNLTYLIHEGLHCLFPYDNSLTDDEINIQHTIIELISDYELYSFLSGKSTLNEGLEFLKEYKMVIYPYWLSYIGLTEKQQKERIKKDNISINHQCQENFENMNILDFFNFCCNYYNNEVAKKNVSKL